MGEPSKWKVKSSVALPDKTIAKIDLRLVGHASPRWRSSNKSEIADEKNLRLSKKRAASVEREVRFLLKGMLPHKKLNFEYGNSPSAEFERGESYFVLGDGLGSRQTLTEAGDIGRNANHASMRRVDIYFSIELTKTTDVVDELEQRQTVNVTSQNWGIRIAGTSGVSVGAKAGAILIQIKNMNTGKVGDFWGTYGGADAGIGIDIANANLNSEFNRFRTPEAMSFGDFKWARFAYTSSSIGLALGYERSRFKFLGFVNGQKPPPKITTSGWTAGSIEISILSEALGTMNLSNNPKDVKVVVTKDYRTRRYSSQATDQLSHRVLFSNESSDISPIEQNRLENVVSKMAEKIDAIE